MPPWLIWTLLALCSWGIWAVLSKLLGNALTAEQCQALSTFGMLPILIPLLRLKSAGLQNASRRGLMLAFVGGLVTCFGNVAYFAALGRGEKVVTVVSLTALYPMVTILLAMLLLRERLNGVQLGGIGLSLVAIWLFNIQSGDSLLSRAVVYAVLPILWWGLSGFLQKVATNHISGEAAALVYLSAFVPIGVYYAWREPWPPALTLGQWLLVLALGFFLAFGNLALIVAFARGGKAAIITPLAGLYPIVSIPVAMVFLGENVVKREWLGIVCALASVAALSRDTPPAPSERPAATVAP